MDIEALRPTEHPDFRSQWPEPETGQHEAAWWTDTGDQPQAAAGTTPPGDGDEASGYVR